MNIKLGCFCAIVTAAVGTAIGIGAAEIATPNFVSRAYQNPHLKYAIIGAVAGLVVGGSQEAVRQTKKQRDREAAEHAYRASLSDRN